MSKIITNPGYSLDDLSIVPPRSSKIVHRSDVNPYYKDFAYIVNDRLDVHENLPIFTAPMPSVIDENLIDTYIENKIVPIIPRTIDFDTRINYAVNNLYFVSFSLQESDYFIKNANNLLCYDRDYKICIDVANGGMDSLFVQITKLKDLYSDKMTIMSGNVANADTYKALNWCGCDYVRVSIGTGSACTTATNLGIYQAMGSLLFDCTNLGLKAKIIADGGINNYRNAFKALALGANYVMLGGWLNSLKNSPGKIETHQGIEYKMHYGMASIEGQKMLGKENEFRAPEGKIAWNKMSNLTIADFTKEFIEYLQSCMSYCGASNLEQFIGKQTLQVLSPMAARQFNAVQEVNP